MSSSNYYMEWILMLRVRNGSFYHHFPLQESCLVISKSFYLILHVKWNTLSSRLRLSAPFTTVIRSPAFTSLLMQTAGENAFTAVREEQHALLSSVSERALSLGLKANVLEVASSQAERTSSSSLFMIQIWCCITFLCSFLIYIQDICWAKNTENIRVFWQFLKGIIT